MKKNQITNELLFDIAMRVANNINWRDYQVTVFREGTVNFSSVIGALPNNKGGIGGGVTIVLNDGRKVVEIYAEGIKEVIFAAMDHYGKDSIKPEGVETIVDICIKHEYRHSCQFDWLLAHGIPLVRVYQDELKFPYSKGPLETDAIAFSNGQPVQEFEDLFAGYLL